MAAAPERRSTAWIWIASTGLVGTIIFINLGPKLVHLAGFAASTLPKVNASLNAVAAILLTISWLAILRKRITLHRRLMFAALATSTVFLISYVVQHSSFPSVKYGGSLGWFYFPMLASHILLAAALVPLVLITLSRALSARFDKHRRIARWTLPIWLYVSITGVMVYLLCAPYY
ncbi:MAG: DUF420 domain-containing protein [Bacteroidetes bacterium]|nr:DUF420 domain-containing protein [Bacteroidota bacterium]MBS1944093.1 DUF420 domain-containing protein [Bacteroidota bacterium]